MLTLLSPFLGIIGGLLPSIVRIFERKQEMSMKLNLLKQSYRLQPKKHKYSLTLRMLRPMLRTQNLFDLMIVTLMVDALLTHYALLSVLL